MNHWSPLRLGDIELEHRLAMAPMTRDHEHHGDDGLLARLRARWPTALVVNHPDANLETRLADIEKGRADMVSIGKMALANPDLVARIRAGAPLNKPDPSTFYCGDARGYTDYPTLAAATHPQAQPSPSA